MGEFKHYDDKGDLHFYLRDNGTFAIICSEGHAWLGRWDDLLTVVATEGKTSSKTARDLRETVDRAWTSPGGMAGLGGGMGRVREVTMDEAPAWLGPMMKPKSK